MPRFDSDGEDTFFDACDDIRTSPEPSSSDDCSTSDEGLPLRKLEYELWAREPMSVQQRRHRFLKGMGFADLVPARMVNSECLGGITTDRSLSASEEKITASSISSSDSSFSENESAPNGAYCIRNLDSGKRYIVHDGGRNGLTNMLKEVGSDNMMTLQEFESLLGLSESVQKFLRREHGHTLARDRSAPVASKKKGIKSLWRSFTKRKSAAGICGHDVHVKNSNTSRSVRTRVQQQKKKFMEFSAVYMDQEIQAHKGVIRVMKFSPSGLYLASGGEDCVVRIWQIREVETSPALYCREVPDEYIDEIKGLGLKQVKGQNRALAIVPKKCFSISDTPLHEFHGHTSDILGMSWSESNCLLTSSKDNTVRMWKVGCDGCAAIFEHTDYVTCVQFNPIDERFFISGSLDGKVRVWDVREKRVVDWADAGDIITALSYQPDGKGSVVGTITGMCRFYDQSGEDMQLDKQLNIKRKKKSAANRITSLQFSTDDPPRLMITSTDSKIRVAVGVDIFQHFKGPWKSKAQSSLSLTSDARYLVSAGLDSKVYIWNLDAPGCSSYKGAAKSVHSCEMFLSEGVTAAASWPGAKHDSCLELSSLPEKNSGTRTLHADPEFCTLGMWFLADSMRVPATWPEENLPSSAGHCSLKPANCSRIESCLSMISSAWNQVIVTASRDGIIRSFHNDGLPVRL